MQQIKDWCVTLSAVSVLSGIFGYLMPKGNLKKAFGILVYMIILYTALQPLKNGEINYADFGSYVEENEYMKEEYSLKAYEPAKAVVEEEISKSIVKAHLEAGMTVKCRVKCELSSDSFSLEEIIIDASLSKNEKTKSRALLEEYKTDKTLIYYTGDSYEESTGENDEDD